MVSLEGESIEESLQEWSDSGVDELAFDMLKDKSKNSVLDCSFRVSTAKESNSIRSIRSYMLEELYDDDTGTDVYKE